MFDQFFYSADDKCGVEIDWKKRDNETFNTLKSFISDVLTQKQKLFIAPKPQPVKQKCEKF